jgi:hypothetical protein
MKLKASQVRTATPVLAAIINENRPLPQKGKYRVGRMHAKLFPEWEQLEERRKAIAEQHQEEVPPAAEGEPATTRVSAAGEAEWQEILAQEIEVSVEPIPLSSLDMGEAVNGSVTAGELQTLGDLVTE